jgi:hypothetical protein
MKMHKKAICIPMGFLDATGEFKNNFPHNLLRELKEICINLKIEHDVRLLIPDGVENPPQDYRFVFYISEKDNVRLKGAGFPEVKRAIAVGAKIDGYKNVPWAVWLYYPDRIIKVTK